MVREVATFILDDALIAEETIIVLLRHTLALKHRPILTQIRVGGIAQDSVYRTEIKNTQKSRINVLLMEIAILMNFGIDSILMHTLTAILSAHPGYRERVYSERNVKKKFGFHIGLARINDLCFSYHDIRTSDLIFK